MSGNTTILNNKKNNLGRLTWGTLASIAVVVLFGAAVSGWLLMAGGYREKVNNLEINAMKVDGRLNKVEEWQRDWPSKGELSLDVGQNTKIEDLRRRIYAMEQRARKPG